MELVTINNPIKIVKKDIKNIILKVKPTCEVILSTPLDIKDIEIEYILKKRKKWIDKKIEFFKNANKIEKKEYVSGENFKYLGKNYRLKVIESKDEFVKLQRGYIQIFVKEKKRYKRKKELLDKWYKQKAQNYFSKIVQEYSKIVKKDIKSIKIRQMKTRWGSCNIAKGYINLNSELIKKTKICIEYVIFHELVHLIYPNHSKEFYNYLDTFMPDWKKRKDKLEDSNLI